MSEKWKDTRIISKDTLKKLPKDMFSKYPDPKKGGRKGNPKDVESDYVRAGCPR